MHGFGRERRHLHRLALNLHHQKMILRRPGADVGFLHLSANISYAQLAARAADEEINSAGLWVRLAHLKIMFVTTERSLDAGVAEKLDPMRDLAQAGGVQRSRGKRRMVEVRDYPHWMRFGEFGLHPMELGAVFQIRGRR